MKFFLPFCLVVPICLIGCTTVDTPDVSGSDGEQITEIPDFPIGADRSEVEAVMGEPDYIGRTKSGDLNCMYKIDDRPDGAYKTVVYDRDGKVLEVYR